MLLLTQIAESNKSRYKKYLVAKFYLEQCVKNLSETGNIYRAMEIPLVQSQTYKNQLMHNANHRRTTSQTATESKESIPESLGGANRYKQKGFIQHRSRGKQYSY